MESEFKYVLTVRNIDRFDEQISNSEIRAKKLIRDNTTVIPVKTSVCSRNTPTPYLWIAVSSSPECDLLE